MKKLATILCASFLASAALYAGELTEKLDSLCTPGSGFFFAADTNKVIDLAAQLHSPKGDSEALAQPLSAVEAQELSAALFSHYQKELKANFGKEWGAKDLHFGKLHMPFDLRLFGEKPAAGRSLYISMHGGGNAPTQLNNQQWMNQIQLYAPAEGVYIAPRAPFDDWNMWFRPEMDFFFERLIQLAVIELDVNPNQVYLMGYSAGGDGVYRMAPRMADSWAACAMMAGHPGDVSPLNLRNIGFTLWVGGDDSAYDRNKIAGEFAEKLAQVKKSDPEGYPYEVHILKGKGHWMDREDAAALPWMAQFQRNPLPEKVAWRQEEEETPQSSFYWLSLPADVKPLKGNTLIVSRNANTFTIEECDYDSLLVNLNDQMIDFSKPVTVLMNGKELFNAKVNRNLLTIYKTLQQRGELCYTFSAQIQINTK